MTKERKALRDIIDSHNETITGMYGLGEVVVGNQFAESFKEELDIIKDALIELETLKKEREEVINIIASALKDYKEFPSSYTEPGEITLSFDGKIDDKIANGSRDIGTTVTEQYDSWNFWNDVIKRDEEMKTFFKSLEKESSNK